MKTSVADQMPVTRRWFEAHAVRSWQRHLEPLKKVSCYLETGVFEGSSLIWAAEHLLAPGGVAYGIDPWDETCLGGDVDRVAKVHETARRRVYAFHARNPDKQIVLVQGRSEVELRLWQQRVRLPPEVIYIDSVHEAPEALRDMALAWHMLPVGGLLVVDDIAPKVMGRRGKKSPLAFEAWEAFSTCHAKRMELVFRDVHQAAARKVA